MTMITTEQDAIQLTLDNLDFDPACAVPECAADHPAATHLAHVIIPCGCANHLPVCASCVAELRHAMAHGMQIVCYLHGQAAPLVLALRLEPIR